MYREDWLKIVVRQRAQIKEYGPTEKSPSVNLNVATSVAEILRGRKEYTLLAIHYDTIGNRELRDEYIEKALKRGASDSAIIFLRGLQKRPDLIPTKVLNRETEFRLKNRDWNQLARVYVDVKNYPDAAKYYLLGINGALSSGEYFGAAFYLKELVREGLIPELFKLALRDATKKHSLWWQLRALQELGWQSEIKDLLRKHRSNIVKSDDLFLREAFARAMGDDDGYVDIRKEMARTMTAVGGGVAVKKFRKDRTRTANS